MSFKFGKRSDDTRLVALAAAAAVATGALILKRRRWTSQRSKAERLAFKDKVAQTLVGPNPQEISVETSKEKMSPLTNLTTYHPAKKKNSRVTVVIVHGFGCTSMEFKALNKLLVQRDNVSIFNYDRVLFANSEGYQGKPRDATTLAIELHALLQNRAITPPYLLLGHSYGGLIAQVFASLYTADTKGLVLMDPAHERQLDTFPIDFGSQFTTLIPCILKVYEKLAWTGLLQFLDGCNLFNFPPLFLMNQDDAEARSACARLYSDGHVWNRVAMELWGCVETFDWLKQEADNDMRQPLQAIPTALVIAGHRQYTPSLWPKRVTKAFLDMHQVSLPLAKVFMANESDHWMHMQQPTVVLEALNHVLEKCQKGQ